DSAQDHLQDGSVESKHERDQKAQAGTENGNEEAGESITEEGFTQETRRLTARGAGARLLHTRSRRPRGAARGTRPKLGARRARHAAQGRARAAALLLPGPRGAADGRPPSRRRCERAPRDARPEPAALTASGRTAAFGGARAGHR